MTPNLANGFSAVLGKLTSSLLGLFFLGLVSLSIFLTVGLFLGRE